MKPGLQPLASDPAGNTTLTPISRRWLEWLHRYRYVLAPLSFGAGLASFLLIERREWLAQWISALLVLGWLLILFEEAAARRLRLSRGVLRFGIQAIQQETFFFTLPFFLHTTTWSTGQAAFTGAALLAGLCSMWDPLYFGRIAKRPWLYLAFHAFAVFIGTLTVTPVLLHLTTSQTVALASAAVAALAVPMLWKVIERQRPLHWVFLFGGALALGALSWELRRFVPPATLWIHEGRVTDTVDAAQREPGPARAAISPSQLHAQGLYAFTAIRAPRGLHERVYHRWLRDGEEVDRIALELVGGRAGGFRAWSYKRGFPADPWGEWKVQVVTEGGQLIGQLRFYVGEWTPPQPAAPQPVDAPGTMPAETPVEASAKIPTEPAPAPAVPEQEPGAEEPEKI